VLPINMLGKIALVDENGVPTGEKVDGGCLTCHIGDGQTAGIFGTDNPDVTVAEGDDPIVFEKQFDVKDGMVSNVPEAAMEGIDCLICHASAADEGTVGGVAVSVFRANGDAAVYEAALSYDFNARTAVPATPETIQAAGAAPEDYLKPDGSQFMLQQDRSTETAQTVGGKAQFAQCFYPCHGFSGGGYSNKKGARFEAGADVHADSGMDCVDCHKVLTIDGQTHRFAAGSTADIMVNDAWDVDISCDNGECHGPAPHGEKLIDMHTDTVDCRTCHITEVKGGIKTRSWTETALTAVFPVWKAEGGDYVGGQWVPPTTKAQVELPNYLWWTDEVDPAAAPARCANPQDYQQAYRDAGGKIYAFKGSTFTIPWEGTHDDGQAVWHKKGYFHMNAGLDTDPGDAADSGWQEAYEKGMNLALSMGIREDLRPDASPWDWQTQQPSAAVEEVNYQITHMVKSGEEAWGCDDCHTDTNSSVLDFEALGYSADEIVELTQPR